MYIELDAYSGPLELLFDLIGKNEIDIYDIPIAKLTGQYLDAIKELPPDMENMSEFLVMAATLLEIKSRMLLPRPKAEEDEEEDPREALVRQLVAYKHCKILAEALKNMPYSGARHFKKPEYPLMSKINDHKPSDWLLDVTTNMLWKTFVDTMKRQARKVDTVRQNFGTIPKDRYTVSDKMSLIEKALQECKNLHLSVLFKKCQTKEECIVTFLAVLEMIRRKKAVVRQEDMFGEIEIIEAIVEAIDD